MSDGRRAEEVLAERPDLADPLSAVLAVDEDREAWTFEDVPVGSGSFGELVSRGLVERTDDDRYRLADPHAVRTALDAAGNGDHAGNRGDGSGGADGVGGAADPVGGLRGPLSSTLGSATRDVDRTTASLVAGALLAVVLARTYVVPSVYRNDDVVLSGNDPYYYRYWVERLLAQAGSPLDPGALAALPDAVRTGEPLFVATLWWVTELVGGTPRVAGHVLAWYPVVSAVVVAGTAYALAVRATGDRRVGLAAVLVLAIVPGHALRTSLGFADHHAFDYVPLVVTALAATALAATSAGDRRGAVDARAVPIDRRTVGLVAVVAVGVAVQTLAWEAGPLLVAPLVAVVAAGAAVDVAVDRSPLPAGLPVALGLGLGAAPVWTVHALAGWHDATVAAAPALSFAAALAALAVAVAVRRTTGDAKHLAGGYLAASGVGVVAFFLAPAGVRAALSTRLDGLFRGGSIAETASLFDPDSLGVVLLLGLTLVLAVPTMVAAVARSTRNRPLLVPTVYAWYFLVLAGVQVRFVGELAAFAAVFAGLGFVRVAAWIDLVEPVTTAAGAANAGGDGRGRGRGLAPLRVPDRRTVGALLALFVLFGALGALQTGVKNSQVTIDDATYETATAIEAHADAVDRDPGRRYVLSPWGRNRVYNYFVNGDSRSYGFARGNYGRFLGSSSPGEWYDRLSGRGTGYVVVGSPDGDTPTSALQSRLRTAYGSHEDGVAGVGRYRAVYVHEGGDLAAFELVPGARLVGRAPPNATLTVRRTRTVSVPGASFDYRRRATADATGGFGIRVAHPGEYRVGVVDGSDSTVSAVDVSPAAVRNGTRVDTGTLGP